MVTKTFCNICGKEIVEEGTKEESAFIGNLIIREFSSLDAFNAQQIWDSSSIDLCPEDLKKVKKLLLKEVTTE